jgi:hypothetical protein
MDKIYNLEKWIWTEKDFSKMKWHDCNIYAVAFQKNDYKLMFDIDYIFEWINPMSQDKYYKFWVSPATLVFENVYDLEIDIDCNLSIEIDTICREQPKQPKNSSYIKKDLEWKWAILTQCGEINFQSVGYKMYVRRQPLLQQSQEIGFVERDGISFYQGRLDL